MAEAARPPAQPPRGLAGFLDALRDGAVVVGWAADPNDASARPVIRLMRGVEVLAEGVADVQRDDGNPGFRLRSPTPLSPRDFLEGRVRVRAMLQGRPVATTLAMTPRMRAVLEAEAEGIPPAPPPQPDSPPPVAAPAEAMEPPPLAAMRRIAQGLAAGSATTLHLLVPRRATVLAALADPALTPLEQRAIGEPALAPGWVPLRQAFARLPQPKTLWREDGRRLAIEGGLALVETLLAVLRVLRPEATEQLARAAAILARADLASLPRREAPDGPGGITFMGVEMRETEPALTADIFYDLPSPRPLAGGLPGLEAWSSPGAPLPWRIVVMAEAGLGGSAGPTFLGWWLRHLVAECVVSEALSTVDPAAILATAPDLVLTLSLEPA